MVQRRNRKMQIFVDADACPVVAIIEKIAKDNSVPVMLLCRYGPGTPLYAQAVS